MINYNNIENVLVRLDNEFNLSLSDPDMPVFFSKLAVIELAGWLEDSIDDMLFEYLDNHLLDAQIITVVKNTIKKNYGFKYEGNIQKICIAVVGANNWENIIDKLNDTDLNNLISITNTLSTSRNNAAHSSIVVTRTFNAPSITLSDFRKIKPAIMTIESEISSI